MFHSPAPATRGRERPAQRVQRIRPRGLHCWVRPPVAMRENYSLSSRRPPAPRGPLRRDRRANAGSASPASPTPFATAQRARHRGAGSPAAWRRPRGRQRAARLPARRRARGAGRRCGGAGARALHRALRPRTACRSPSPATGIRPTTAPSATAAGPGRRTAWPARRERRSRPGLTLPAGAEVASKATGAEADAYSGFDHSSLAGWLRTRGVRRLFVGGLGDRLLRGGDRA